MIHSLSKQVRKPNDIIIALSETNKIDALNLEKKLKQIFYNCKVYSTITNQKSWENRDRGASISKSDILIFLDADDECHPQRIKIGMELAEIKNAEFILFGGGSHNTEFDTNTDYDYITGDDIFQDELKSYGKCPITIKHFNTQIPYNNGVPLVKFDLWWKYGGQSKIVSNNSELKKTNGIGEDIIFSRSILNKLEDKRRFMIVNKILLRKHASSNRNETHWNKKITSDFINLEDEQKLLIDKCIKKYKPL